MAKIELISASAGSGKTYRLAEALEHAVTQEHVRPGAILATTFTRKAAAELQERVRRRLLEANRFDDALALSGARIGTVNSVAGALVQEFAFQLGLSPQLRILDEVQARLELRKSVSRVVTAGDEACFADLQGRFTELDWEQCVQQIVDAARQNRIPAARLVDCGERSARALLHYVGPVAQPLGPALLKAIETSLAALDKQNDSTKTTAAAVDRLQRARSLLASGRRLPWKEWHALGGVKAAKKSESLVEPVRQLAMRHLEDPQFGADLRTAIERTFAIAARVLQAYEELKTSRGVIDFIDQEVLALRLLRLPEARSRLQSELDLVMVDEFQDTSPLQLSLFLELSELAKRSIWVGDQKQSIYGFRGADPALMDAAFEQILGGARPETLKKSWRSRPELVHVTSEIFAHAFAQQGMPGERVRLEPAKKEPAGLGDCVEVWSLLDRNKPMRFAAVAEGIRQLLAEETSRVREVHSDEVRRARAGDVAVLCRSNEDCRQVASALEGRGIRAVVPQAGLLGTAEAALIIPALRLFADPGESLAKAELARMLVYPSDPDGFLARVVEEGGSGTGFFAKLQVVTRLREARERHPTAGALQAFDAVCEALDVHGQLLAWGNADLRLANLEALRAYAVEYTASCASQGTGSSPAGLVAFLEELAAGSDDEQATVLSDDAVVVSTWHAAKGLEWPITVICGAETMRDGNAWGVKVVTEAGKIDLSDPLAGRWIRFWPNPYDPANTKTPLHDALAAAPEVLSEQEREKRQQLRVLYVAWTRARDRLVLAMPGGKLDAGALALLSNEKGALAGVTLGAKERTLTAVEPEAQPRRASAGHPTQAPREFPPAFAQPSSVEAVGTAGEAELLGERFALVGRPEMEALGMALHGFFAADREQWPERERLELAKGLLERWGVQGAVEPEALLQMSARLRSWAARIAPGAKWRAEWPAQERLAEGTVLRGSVDLVLEESDGFFVIDHKSFPGTAAESVQRARGHAGQLAAYARMLERATGKPLKGAFIHLPVVGMMVPVEWSERVQARHG